MEEVVCKFQKFGFCKYKESCEKRHLEETCEKLSYCESQRKCHKRHPYACKRYVLEGFCKFGSHCAYHHQTLRNLNNESEVNDKVEKLEKKTVNKLTEKILQLESKIKAIETKDVEAAKIKETEQRVEVKKKVELNKNGNSKEVKENKSKPKDNKVSVFKF